ncbi:MAG: 3-keto-5-aminohexanoate cleavage protein, partial [Emcibacter sp.]|nr:3-keto-5-aminohexanoate cleavage protein [Emcibacter sp.]
MTAPFIIMCAPNGARRQKTDHPNIPITPDEIARCTEEIIAAGASILHLHVRDAQGGHSLDVGRYRAAISAIRDVVDHDIIIQATSEAVGKYSRPEQMAMVKELRPEAVSLSLRELIPDDTALSDMVPFMEWMAQEHIFPQYILYDEADYQRFEAYRKQGIFQTDQPFALFVLGSYMGNDQDSSRL